MARERSQALQASPCAQSCLLHLRNETSAHARQACRTVPTEHYASSQCASCVQRAGQERRCSCLAEAALWRTCVNDLGTGAEETEEGYCRRSQRGNVVRVVGRLRIVQPRRHVRVFGAEERLQRSREYGRRCPHMDATAEGRHCVLQWSHGSGSRRRISVRWWSHRVGGGGDTRAHKTAGHSYGSGDRDEEGFDAAPGRPVGPLWGCLRCLRRRQDAHDAAGVGRAEQLRRPGSE